MRIEPKKCPCGCSNVILEPVCGCQCSSVRPEEAHTLATRVNRFEDVLAMLEAVALNRGEELKKGAAELVAAVKAELNGPVPDFPAYPWAQNRR